MRSFYCSSGISRNNNPSPSWITDWLIKESTLHIISEKRSGNMLKRRLSRNNWKSAIVLFIALSSSAFNSFQSVNFSVVHVHRWSRSRTQPQNGSHARNYRCNQHSKRRKFCFLPWKKSSELKIRLIKEIAFLFGLYGKGGVRSTECGALASVVRGMGRCAVRKAWSLENVEYGKCGVLCTNNNIFSAISSFFLSSFLPLTFTGFFIAVGYVCALRALF